MHLYVIPVLTAQPEPFENAKHAKRSKIPNNVAFEINGQKILYSFYQSILNACDGDREMAGRVFFRAKCRSKEPIKWISAGMMRKDGEKYALKSIREEDENPQAVREWIDTVVNHEEVLSDRG